MALAPSSPRLPSPPPPAEIQIGPNSPSGGAAADPATTQMEQNLVDSNARRRIHPGTKASDMAAGPPLVPLGELDSAFQLQEHLAALHYEYTERGTRPIDRTTATQLAHPPAGIDRTLWLYELCRFLIAQCNTLIVGFLFDAPPCSASTCPEMRASEWQFLCAVHEQPKSCCAIDYCCHTLDWAANVVTDQKLFPSRFVAPDPSSSSSLAHAGSGKNASVKSLVNVFRRLHRIFAHAWFQHRNVFWSVESQSGLYVFFKMVCDLYELLPAENYKLPPEAEGIEEPAPAAAPAASDERPTPVILKPPQQSSQQSDEARAANTNTKRHIRSSPSTGSAVTTVIEAEEEETDGVTQRVRQLQISDPATADERSTEVEVAEVPMMVEDDTKSPQTPAAITPADTEDDDDNNSDADQTAIDVGAEDEEKPAAAEDEAQPEQTQDTTEGSLPQSSTTVKLDTATEESATEEPAEPAAAGTEDKPASKEDS